MLQPELDLTTRTNAAQLTEAGVGKHVPNASEVHLVEGVEEFRAELESLFAPGQNLLQQREIARGEVRVRQDVAASRPVNTSSRTLKCVLVEEVRDHIRARGVLAAPVCDRIRV